MPTTYTGEVIPPNTLQRLSFSQNKISLQLWPPFLPPPILLTPPQCQFALSGRSSCKFCKEKILEGEMRIRTSAQSEGDDKVFESSRHVKCQSLPQVNKKANQVNATHPHIHASTHTYTHTHIHTKNHPQSTKQTHFSAFPLSLSQSMTDWVDSDAFTCAPHVEKKSQNVLKTASEVYDLIVAGLNEPRYKKPKVDKATASVAEGGSPTKIKQMKQMMEDKKRKVEDLDSEIEDVTPSKKTKLEFGGSSPSEEEVSNSQLQHSQLSTPNS